MHVHDGPCRIRVSTTTVCAATTWRVGHIVVSVWKWTATAACMLAGTYHTAPHLVSVSKDLCERLNVTNIVKQRLLSNLAIQLRQVVDVQSLFQSLASNWTGHSLWPEVVSFFKKVTRCARMTVLRWTRSSHCVAPCHVTWRIVSHPGGASTLTGAQPREAARPARRPRQVGNNLSASSWRCVMSEMFVLWSSWQHKHTMEHAAQLVLAWS